MLAIVNTMGVTHHQNKKNIQSELNIYLCYKINTDQRNTNWMRKVIFSHSIFLFLNFASYIKICNIFGNKHRHVTKIHRI